MALLATQVPTQAAGLLAPVYSAANASDTFVPNDRTLLYVKNTNAATRTITLTTPATSRGIAIADPVNTIGATTGELVFGGLSADLYADPTTGLCTVTPSATAGVTYAVIQINPG
jgi:hypothetical protein